MWKPIRSEDGESTFGGGRSHLHLRAGASVAGFIVDFYCHKAALVVEVDGDIHDLQQEEDARREKALSALGLRIARFRNDEVVRELSAVVGRIREFAFQ
jgi:very-short-patch-repair endonuclease